MAHPDPFTPPDCDLRDFLYMPLDVVRLRDSEAAIVLPADEFRAALLLWCAAWHQVPAASLPANDRLLANLAGYGRDLESWLAVKEGALRGFIECSDGRLYHPVVAEKARESWHKKWERPDRAAQRSEHARKAAQARWEKSRASTDAIPEQGPSTSADAAQSMPQHVPAHMPECCPSDALKGREGKGEEGKESPMVADATVTAITPALFQRFWETYPKREGANPREPARKKFLAAVKSGKNADAIIVGAAAYAEQMRRTGKFGTQYVAQAVTWLTQQRWNDDYRPVQQEEIREQDRHSGIAAIERLQQRIEACPDEDEDAVRLLSDGPIQRS